MSSSGALALLPEHSLRDLVDLLGRLMEGLRVLAIFPAPCRLGDVSSRRGRTPNVEALVALRLDLNCFLWPGNTHEEAHGTGARPI
jgi:hypothetical protein